MMKETYTHVALAGLVGILMYALSFIEAYNDMKSNALAVVFMLLCILGIGYFYAAIFYDEKPKRGKPHEDK